MENSDNKITKQVISQIKEKQVKPKPKWYFDLKNTSFWVAFGVSLVLASFAGSVLVLRLLNNDWGIHRNLGRNPVAHLFMNLPYIWLLLVFLLLMFALYNLKHTKKGYRNLNKFLIAGLAVWVAGGLVVYFVGYSDSLDRKLGDKPLFAPFGPPVSEVWQQPEKGLLAGTIVTYPEDNMFVLEDFDGHDWEVVYGAGQTCSNKILQPSLKVRVQGEKIDANIFRAEKIRPWRIAPPVPRYYLRTVK